MVVLKRADCFSSRPLLFEILADYSAIPYLLDAYKSNVRLAEIILQASFK